jgi:hypothetical protein
MDTLYYIFHRMYNALREFTYPSLVRYYKFKQIRKQKNKKFWKEKQYLGVDK